ncbi:MAG TPA: methyltransferase domain-containing protein [Candidatus Angelobacter sp.]|nr:methyltransferase domain-containing protein [Candidatus Angelobacter sp.]
MNMQHIYTNMTAREACLISNQLPGEGQSPEKMQGHWVLARAGKRVLRPGGIELTRKMLDTLSIGPEDDVIEFAPGMGATAGLVLARQPHSFCAVERDAAAAEIMRKKFSGVQIVGKPAEESGLPDACASVVYSEALLSMQTLQQKERIIAEASRLLIAGGRYGIQELCLLPDNISGELRQEIRAAMSREIHVGVQPLCCSEWIRLFEENELKVKWIATAPMHLLEPRRLLQDEGVAGACRIVFRAATNPALGGRILAMRRLFQKYGEHLGAISLVGERCPRDEERVA